MAMPIPAIPLVPGRIYDIYYEFEPIKPSWRKKELFESYTIETGLEYMYTLGNTVVFNRISQEEDISESGVVGKEIHRLMVPYGWIKKFVEWPQLYQPEPPPEVQEVSEEQSIESKVEVLSEVLIDPPPEPDK